jgi:hypothetical protein
MKKHLCSIIILLFSFILSAQNNITLSSVEGYNKSSVLKHPKIQLKEQKDETV